MVRAKGGKRQPRYFYLKDKGAEKICRYMEIKRKDKSSVEKRDEGIEEQIKKIDAKIEEFSTLMLSIQLQLWSNTY